MFCSQLRAGPGLETSLRQLERVGEVAGAFDLGDGVKFENHVHSTRHQWRTRAVSRSLYPTSTDKSVVGAYSHHTKADFVRSESS